VVQHPIGLQGAQQQVESVWIAFESKNPSAPAYSRRRDLGVESEISADIENHRIGSEKAAEDKDCMLLDRLTDKVRDRVDRVGIDRDVFAGVESDQCPVGPGKDGCGGYIETSP
jgi:hypothetical protein